MSAELNDLNPQAYLTYVLERIADHSVNRVDKLLTPIIRNSKT